jgi:hypothetical protein
VTPPARRRYASHSSEHQRRRSVSGLDLQTLCLTLAADLELPVAGIDLELTAMATIYLSSTFTDLRECRERVTRALGRLNHRVISMENYVARDDRPVDACLRDVAGCDVYVGLFAHRYGFVPDDPRNQDKLSITELELRAAKQAGKPCLVFLQDPAAPWPTIASDSHSGDNEGGARIRQLRKELEERYLRVLFRGADDIGELVASSVTNALGGVDEKSSSPDPRQITTSCLLLHSPADAAWAQALAGILQQQRLSVTLSPRALLSSSASDFEELDAEARGHQVALVYVTPHTVGQCATRAADVARVMSLLAARTGGLIAVCHSSTPPLPPEWPITDAVQLDPEVPEVGQVSALVTALETRSPTVRARAVVGLPFVIVAMTGQEAQALQDDPDSVGALLTAQNLKRFGDLRAALDAGPEPWPRRYGASRQDWRPFAKTESIRVLLQAVVDRLNQSHSAGGRKIKLQYYPIDPVVTRDPVLRPVYVGMARAGCVAIVDELSLFHPAIRPQIQSLLNQPQVSVITISPVSAPNTFDELLVSEARRQLGDPFNRWELDFDPQCEFGVAAEHHLRRWLYRSLPETMRQTERGVPDRAKLDRIRTKVGDPQGMGGVLFPQRGGR